MAAAARSEVARCAVEEVLVALAENVGEFASEDESSMDQLVDDHEHRRAQAKADARHERHRI